MLDQAPVYICMPLVQFCCVDVKHRVLTPSPTHLLAHLPVTQGLMGHVVVRSQRLELPLLMGHVRTI